MGRPSKHQAPTGRDPIDELTTRQCEVLALIAKGLTNAEIGEKLDISLDGAKWHVGEVMTRLQVERREDAAERWREHNRLPSRIGPPPRRTLALTPFRLIAAAAGLAAGAGMTALIVTTSGPFAGDDEGTSNQVAASPTPAETAKPEGATPTPTATATSTPPTASATATPPGVLRLDADGWPVVDCPAGTEVVRAKTRKLTVCGPVGNFALSDFERDGSTDDPNNGQPDFDKLHSLLWRHRELNDYFLTVQIISREGSPFGRENYQAPCATNEPTGSALSDTTALLGLPASRCIWLSGVPEKPVVGGEGRWAIEAIVETDEFWIIADATGPQFGAERDTAMQQAHDLFGLATANGLERVP